MIENRVVGLVFRCLMGSREDSRSRSESESDDSDRSSTESTNEQEEGERSPTPQKKSKKSKSHKKVFSGPIAPTPVWSEILDQVELYLWTTANCCGDVHRPQFYSETWDYFVLCPDI